MKKLLSRTLSCALVLGMLGTVAMAAEQTVSSGTGSVTLSDVVSTETKTLTIDGEQKEITIHYVSAGSTFQINSSDPDDFPGETEYEEMNGAFDSAGGGQVTGGEVYTFAFEYAPLYALYTTPGAEKVFCMLSGQQSAAPAPTTPADTTTPAPTETVPAAPADAVSYAVQRWDTYGQLALNHYGSYGVWKALYKANNYAKLTPGTQLVLPDTLGTAKRIGMPVAGDGETLYAVKAGDSLSGIALEFYGNTMKYQAIFERNSDRLTNANTIYEGQIIVLPAK